MPNLKDKPSIKNDRINGLNDRAYFITVVVIFYRYHRDVATRAVVDAVGVVVDEVVAERKSAGILAVDSSYPNGNSAAVDDSYYRIVVDS